MLHKKAQAPCPLPSPILNDATFRKWHLCLLCSISQPPHVPDIRSALWDVCPRCPVSSVGYHHLPRLTNSMIWWPADGSVGPAPRNPVTGLPFFNCTLQQPRIIVLYSVVVGENLTQFHQPRPHYDHFFLDSVDQATMTDQYENEASSTASEWCDVLDADHRS